MAWQVVARNGLPVDDSSSSDDDDWDEDDWDESESGDSDGGIFNASEVERFEGSASDVLADFQRAIVNTSPATGANPLHAQAARRRLLRDYKEVLSYPTPGVSAAPLDDNIFWPGGGDCY